MEVERSDAATELLNKGKLVDVSDVFDAPDGSTIRAPKKGTLVQLGVAHGAEQYILDMPTIQAKGYKDLTLTALEDAVPVEVWRIIKTKAEKFSTIVWGG